MRKIFAWFILFLLIACNSQMDLNMNTELIKVDKAFSTMCVEEGMNYAFIHYVADDGVMLRPNSMPVVGKTNIESLFRNDDKDIKFTWKPLYGEVAKSGELGYTYGTYKFGVGESQQKGTYVSIWKKNTKGEWKFVLDSGNEGLGNQE